MGRNPIYQGNNDQPIEFSVQLAERLQSYIFSHMEEDFRFLIIPGDLIQATGNEFKRFLCALQAYRDSPNPVMPIPYLVDGLTDINFARKLKGLRQKAWLLSVGNNICDTNEELENLQCPFRIKDIGDMFNFKYWFWWKEPEPEDYTKGYEPLSPISLRDQLKFKRALHSLLPSDVQVVEEEEILLQNSSSAGIDDKTLLSKPVYKLKENANKFSSSPLTCKRSIIYKSPTDVRDAVILSVPQSNSVKLIEKQCSEIAQNMQYSLHVKDLNKFNVKLSKFNKKFYYFFNRDIEKEGITKPRKIIQMILEVLEEKYPGLPAWQYSGIYKDLFLYTHKGIENPARGHGLGMANSLTTIMQCAIFRIAQEEMYTNYEIEDSFSAIFFNDDCVIGFKSETDLNTYIDYEEDLFKRFSLLRKLNKSSIGPSSVFCEIYYNEYLPTLNDKTSYKLTELYNCFAAQNIVQAKWLIANTSRQVLVKDIEAYMEDIIRFWSYEFYPNEWRNPFSSGGWISPSYIGVRLDNFIRSGPLEYDEAAAFISCCENNYLTNYEKGESRTYEDPLSQIYPDLDLPEQIQKRLLYRVSLQDVEKAFAKFSSRETLTRAWERLRKSRLRAFERTQSKTMSIEEHLYYLEKYFDQKDFLPHPDLVKEELYIPDSERIYVRFKSANPTLSLIKFYNKDKIRQRVIPTRYGIEINPNDRKLTSEERKQVYKCTNLFRDNQYLSADVYIDEFVHPEANKLYLTPHKVMRAYASFTGKEALPITETRCRRELTKDEIIDIYLLSHSEIGPHYLSLINKKGYEKARENLLSDSDESLDFLAQNLDSESEDEQHDLPEDLEEIIEEVKEEMAQEEAESPTVEPLGTHQFWVWRQDPGLPVNENIEWAFITLDNYLAYDQAAGNQRPEARLRNQEEFRTSRYNYLMRGIWIDSGGRISADGLPELQVVDWDDGSDGESVGLGDLF